jgi:hypothetical protein
VGAGTSYTTQVAYARSLWVTGLQFWLFTIYDKDEMTDLTPQQRKAFKVLLKAELEASKTG